MTAELLRDADPARDLQPEPEVRDRARVRLDALIAADSPPRRARRPVYVSPVKPLRLAIDGTASSRLSILRMSLMPEQIMTAHSTFVCSITDRYCPSDAGGFQCCS